MFRSAFPFLGYRRTINFWGNTIFPWILPLEFEPTYGGSAPLKNMKVSWDDEIPNIWKIKFMFQTTSQIINTYTMLHHLCYLQGVQCTMSMMSCFKYCKDVRTQSTHCVSATSDGTLLKIWSSIGFTAPLQYTETHTHTHHLSHTTNPLKIWIFFGAIHGKH